MTKGELKNIILKIRALTGLSEPERITYFWNEDGLVVFKFWFDSLIIPREMLLKKDDNEEKSPKDDEPLIWGQEDNAPNFQKGFSNIEYNDDYDDDYVIKEINTDEGYVVVITDQQDFKKVSSYKAAEDVGEDEMNESVILATKATPRKLTESYGLITEDEDVADENKSLQNNLEAQSIEKKVETEEEKKEDVNIEKDLLIVNIPLAATLNKEATETLAKKLNEKIDVIGKELNVKITYTSSSGISQQKNLANLCEAVSKVDPKMSMASIYSENSAALKATIKSTTGAGKKVYATVFPPNFKVPADILPELKAAGPFTGDSQIQEAIKEIEGAANAIYVKSLANLDEKVKIVKDKLIPVFNKFVSDFIDRYKPDAATTEEKDSEDGDEDESPKEQTESNMMVRLLNHIREAEGDSGEESNSESSEQSEESEQNTENTSEEKKPEENKKEGEEETSRQKAWKASTKYLSDKANNGPGSVAFILNEFFTKPDDDFAKDLNDQLRGQLKEAATDSRKKALDASSKIESKDKETVSQAASRISASEWTVFAIDSLFASSTSDSRLGTGNKSATALFTKVTSKGPKAPKGKGGAGADDKGGNLQATPSDFYTFACLEGDDIVKDVGGDIEGQTPKAFCESKFKVEA